jgi:hypothetical protein
MHMAFSLTRTKMNQRILLTDNMNGFHRQDLLLVVNVSDFIKRWTGGKSSPGNRDSTQDEQEGC